MDKEYNFKDSESKWQDFWIENQIFKNKGKSTYSIDTPPPTVSGKMHIGHAFSYIHQDIIARFKRMTGHNVFYPFGTDDNGLPTAKLVENINNIRFFDLTRTEFISLAEKTVENLLPEFIKGWKNIGMSCDFSEPYSTISKESQKTAQESFADLYNKNRVYRKESPVLWCPECQTAIAQAELEDKEKNALFSDIDFKLKDGGIVTIATTRPELLPGCVALLINPKDGRSKDLVGTTAITPLFNQEIPILADELVDLEKGTGIVMVCTFGDVTDIEWQKKHDLPLRICINKDGTMNELAGEFQGLTTKETRKQILIKLSVENQKQIVHSVNVHERCGTPIEIIVMTQWFIKYLDLKKDFLKQSEKLNWHPEHMKNRLDNWIEGLKWDWNISRQRFFGIPIPVWYCCGETILGKDFPIDPTTTEMICPKCKKPAQPEKDVFDTWFTSSLTPQINNEKLPMSLRPQAHDIINFWLFYTLVKSYLHENKLPFKDVIISGFVLDPKGEKMSKSKGNIVEPKDVIEQYGADSIRFWASQAALGVDLRFSEDQIKQGKRTITKLWNASKFSLMHLEGYDPKNKGELQDEDKWLFSKLHSTTKEYIQKMEQYEYTKARDAIDKFFWNDFCDYYLEIVKSRVYETKDVGAQYTIYNALLSILKLYSPILPHITEEIYQGYFKQFEKTESIHLTQITSPKDYKTDFELAIDAIAQIRKYKSENQMSMKAEIETITLMCDKKVEKYFDLIKKLLSVKEIKLI
jgi:valyl-tRNA synthetase